MAPRASADQRCRPRRASCRARVHLRLRGAAGKRLDTLGLGKTAPSGHSAAPLPLRPPPPCTNSSSLRSKIRRHTPVLLFSRSRRESRGTTGLRAACVRERRHLGVALHKIHWLRLGRRRLAKRHRRVALLPPAIRDKTLVLQRRRCPRGESAPCRARGLWAREVRGSRGVTGRGSAVDGVSCSATREPAVALAREGWLLQPTAALRRP